MKEWHTLNLAHRGFTLNAPENSMAAFQAALDLGADGIEFDVRTCKSGELVVLHDSKLERMTDGRGFVKDKTFDELKVLRLQYGGAESEPVPFLEDVLDLVRDRALLNIEIEANGLPIKPGIAAKVVEIVRRHGLVANTIISSFNPLVLRKVRKIDQQMKCGFLIDGKFKVRNSEILFARVTGAQAVHLEETLASPELVCKVLERGYLCLVWTVNEPESMKKFIEMGVSGIITDKAEVLKETKARWANA